MQVEANVFWQKSIQTKLNMSYREPYANSVTLDPRSWTDMIKITTIVLKCKYKEQRDDLIFKNATDKEERVRMRILKMQETKVE